MVNFIEICHKFEEKDYYGRKESTSGDHKNILLLVQGFIYNHRGEYFTLNQLRKDILEAFPGTEITTGWLTKILEKCESCELKTKKNKTRKYFSHPQELEPTPEGLQALEEELERYNDELGREARDDYYANMARGRKILDRKF